MKRGDGRIWRGEFDLTTEAGEIARRIARAAAGDEPVDLDQILANIRTEAGVPLYDAVKASVLEKRPTASDASIARAYEATLADVKKSIRRRVDSIRRQTRSVEVVDELCAKIAVLNEKWPDGGFGGRTYAEVQEKYDDVREIIALANRARDLVKGHPAPAAALEELLNEDVRIDDAYKQASVLADALEEQRRIWRIAKRRASAPPEPVAAKHLCVRCRRRERHFDDLCKRCANETGARPHGKVA